MENISMEEQLVYDRPESMASVQTHYCPGCTHGVAHRLVAEVIDEMGADALRFSMIMLSAQDVYLSREKFEVVQLERIVSPRKTDRFDNENSYLLRQLNHEHPRNI